MSFGVPAQGIFPDSLRTPAVGKPTGCRANRDGCRPPWYAAHCHEPPICKPTRNTGTSSSGHLRLSHQCRSRFTHRTSGSQTETAFQRKPATGGRIFLRPPDIDLFSLPPPVLIAGDKVHAAQNGYVSGLGCIPRRPPALRPHAPRHEILGRKGGFLHRLLKIRLNPLGQLYRV